MGQLNHLKTNDSTGVRNASLPNSGGVVTRGNPVGFGSDDIAQTPRVPNAESTEVAITEGGVEPCTATYAGEGDGKVTEIATKAATYSPDAHKGISVKSHPQLAAAHRRGSISHQDHRDVHTPEKCAMKVEGVGMATITTLASGSQKKEDCEKGADRPVVAELGKSRPMTLRGR